jgi:hypothetical protein
LVVLQKAIWVSTLTITKVFHPNVSRHGDIGIDSIQKAIWVSTLIITKVRRNREMEGRYDKVNLFFRIQGLLLSNGSGCNFSEDV